MKKYIIPFLASVLLVATIDEVVFNPFFIDFESINAYQNTIENNKIPM